MHAISWPFLPALVVVLFLSPELCLAILFLRHRQHWLAAKWVAWDPANPSRCLDFARSVLATLNPTPLKPMQLREYHYIDVLHLIGGLDELDQRLFKINGRAIIEVDRRMFLVLLVLFCHSLKKAGKTVPMDVPTTEFLSAQMILNAIEAFFTTLPHRPFVFKEATDPDIIRTINQIRKKLDAMGFHKFLIRPGPAKKGYALATPPENNYLIFLDPRDGSTWDLSGK